MYKVIYYRPLPDDTHRIFCDDSDLVDIIESIYSAEFELVSIVHSPEVFK